MIAINGLNFAFPKNKVFQDFIDKFIISNDSNKIAELKNINSLNNHSNEYKSLYKEVKF